MDTDLVYWTLTPREDDRGRRLKLVRNRYGSRHTIASERTRGVTRSATTATGAVSSSKGSFRRLWRSSSKTQPSSERGNSRLGHVAVAVADGDGWRRAEADEEPGLGAGTGNGEELALLRLDERGEERQDIRAMSAKISLWRDLCKYQRKSIRIDAIGEGSEEETEEEDDEQEDEEEELEDDSDGGGSSAADEAAGGSRRKNRSGGGLGLLQTHTTFFSKADIVQPFCATPGIVALAGQRLTFTRSLESSSDEAKAAQNNSGGAGKTGDQTLSDNYRWALRPAPNSSWPTSGLRRVLFRSYEGMRFAGLELWFKGGSLDDNDSSAAEGTVLLGLPSEPVARALHYALRRTRPPALESFLGRLPATVVARSKAGTWGASTAGGVGMLAGNGFAGAGVGSAAATIAEAGRTALTHAWVNRRCGVTNFDYLRGLNAAAGRTTADLSRYPVFPWVLSERAWQAEELDLKDERNFRDLAWPMGAQRPEQREVGYKMCAHTFLFGIAEADVQP